MGGTPAGPRWTLRRALWYGFLLGALGAVGGHVAYILTGSNFHTVIPGAVYRSAQPDGPLLEQFVQSHGIRTVLNLNGCCDPLAWYLEEARATNRLNVSQEDLGMSAGRLPSVPAVRHLVEVLDRSQYPILVHCHRGVDRTGLVSGVALLLYTDVTLAHARGQLGLLRGHLAFGRTGNLDRFFDLYAEWLLARRLQHSPDAFRRWALNDYCPGECRCRIEVLGPGPASGPQKVPRGRPFALRVRCTNTSVKPWRFRAGTTAGIHACFRVFDDAGRPAGEGRAGLFHATVAVGEHIDLTLAVPALRRPGRYRLLVDLADEQHAHFLQAGSEPLTWEVEVP